MRIKVVLQPVMPAIIPWDYQHCIASFIYNVLKKADPTFAKALHDGNERVESKPIKPFCFSWLQFRNRCRTEPDGFVPGIYPIEFILSSPLDDLNLLFIKYAWGENLYIGQAWYQVSAIEIIPEYRFTKSSHTFTSITPVVAPISTISEKEQKPVKLFLDPHHHRFCQVLKQNILRKYALLTGNKAEQDINFRILEGGIKSKLINYKGSKIRGYQIRIQAEADPELLSIIYSCGLGSYNSLGFGMMEA